MDMGLKSLVCEGCGVRFRDRVALNNHIVFITQKWMKGEIPWEEYLAGMT